MYNNGDSALTDDDEEHTTHTDGSTNKEKCNLFKVIIVAFSVHGEIRKIIGRLA